MRGTVRRWLVRGIGGVMIAALITLALVPALAVAADDVPTYANDVFSFTIPDGWEQDNGDDGDVIAPKAASPVGDMVVEFDSADPVGSFTVVTAALPDGATLDTFVPQALAQTQQRYVAVQTLGVQQVALGEDDARQVDFTGMSNGVRLSISQVYTVHEGTVYILTVATTPQSIGAFKGQMSDLIGSWAFM